MKDESGHFVITAELLEEITALSILMILLKVVNITMIYNNSKSIL